MAQSATTARSERSAWKSYLTSEAWSLTVTETDDCRVLATCALPRESGVATTMTLVYGPGEGDHEPRLSATLPGVTRARLLPRAGLLGVHAHGRHGNALCRFDDLGREHDLVATVDGLLGLAHHRASGLVVALEGTGLAHADPFAAARVNPSGNALTARRRVSGWRLRVLRVPADGVVDGAQAPAVTLPIAELVEEGVYPTGEIGCADTDTVLLGVARDQGDGRRQLGLCVVTVSTGRARSVWHEDYDLHGAVPDAERGCALRASIRRHDADDPLRHELWWCATARDALSSQVIDDGRQLWRRPVAWSDHGLCALTVERGRRRLEVLGDGRWTHVPTVRTPAGSVSSVVVEAATATWVESSPSTPPVLCRVDIGATRPPVVIDQGEAPPAVLGQIHHHQHLIASEPQQHATASTVMLPVTSEPRGVIALFHGGPTMAWVDWSWRWNAVPYLEQGYAVVLVDPAGSDGYGSASWRVAWRNWRHGITASAVRTLETALDRHGLGHLPLVTMGGSFGGYLAMAVAGELNPVLVAAHATPVRPSEVSLSSDAFWSWTREWGPLTDHARALERESLDLSLVPGRTRVLLSHGMLDEQVPFHQSVVAARELRMRGVQCDLVLLPDAGHALGRPDWIMKWYEWTLEALERIGEPATC